MNTRLPAPGDAVVVIDADRDEHRCQVVSTTDLSVGLLGPRIIKPGAPLLRGADITLAWAETTASVSKMRSTLLTIASTGAHRVWEADAAGTPWREQRRQWDRVTAAGPVTITEIATDSSVGLGGPPRVTAGELLDISEVATRCSIETDAVWARRRNHPVLLSFTLDRHPLEITGRILGHHPNDPHRANEIVVQFDRPCPAEHTLRHHVARDTDHEPTDHP